MIGTTRPRVSIFMNKFRKLGFIDYNGGGWSPQFATERGSARLGRPITMSAMWGRANGVRRMAKFASY
jgi:hypothetical protein